MPGPLLLPLLSLGVSAAGTGANIAATGANNRKQRQWNEMMYAKQRQDSLSDWAMQNEYNSPQAQMERLRNADLNPNLVYGTGAVANSSQQPRSASAGSYSPQTPNFDFSNSIQAFQDTRVNQAQYDNLRMHQTLMAQDLIAKTLENRKRTVDAELKERLKEISYEAATMGNDLIKQRLINMETQQYNMLDENQRKWEVHQQAIPILKQRLLEAVLQVAEREQKVSLTEQQVAKIKKELDLMEKDGKLKDLEIQMREKGLTPGDPWYFRMGAKIWDSIF